MDDGLSRPTTGNSTRKTSQSIRSGSFLATLVPTNNRKRCVEEAKLLLLIIPSLIVVVSLCSLSLKTVSTSIQLQSTLEANVKDSQSVGQLAAALQRERGRTCVFVTTLNVFSHATNSTNVINDANSTMTKSRLETDAALQNVARWLGNPSDGPQFANKSTFNETLMNYRSDLPLDDQDCEDSLQYFTALGRTLIQQLNRPFGETEDGQFWSMVESYHALLLAKDYIGLQRAMGGAFFAKGQFKSIEEFTSFAKIVGAADQLLSFGLMLSTQTAFWYDQKISSNLHLISDLIDMRQQILDNGVNKSTPDPTKGLVWFDNVTSYLALIDEVDQRVSELILKTLEVKSDARKLEYYLTIAAVVAVLLLCPPITCWYAIQSRNLMYRIEKFVRRLSHQTHELTVEKQKADFLLYQLLPKSIALELKTHKIVAPEHYEEATVYFSDIQGFTALSTKSTPLQVVEFLNQLYTKCDQILDQNDVYKVETIGDAYMVVSGVPRRNGKNHSAEMVSTALKILMALEECVIPHMPDQRLLMRIGIHTGSVAAGVVGNKMPRYCLFGDTVTTASKMESTGHALRIHISPWTNGHLHAYHPDRFETVERGTVDIKTKGIITTYWVVGKKDFPFRVDLEHTAEITSRMTYWKSQYTVPASTD